MISFRSPGRISSREIFKLMSETPNEKLLELCRDLIVRGQSKARVQAILNEYVRQRRWWGGGRKI